MSTTYHFSGATYREDQLAAEINALSLASGTLQAVNGSGATAVSGSGALATAVNVVFDNTLSGGDETSLDAAVAAHVPVNPRTGTVEIGDVVQGGTANYVLFVDASGNLGQTSRLQFDAANNRNLQVSDGTHTANLSDGTQAGLFSDGTRVVHFCNGTFAIQVDSGSGIIDFPGVANNTLRWENTASAPGTNAGTPTTAYGGNSGGYLGDPNFWILVEVVSGGVTSQVKIPCYT